MLNHNLPNLNPRDFQASKWRLPVDEVCTALNGLKGLSHVIESNQENQFQCAGSQSEEVVGCDMIWYECEYDAVYRFTATTVKSNFIG